MTRCIRCGKKFDDRIPVMNTISNNVQSFFACPYCGKLHEFRLRIVIEPVNDVWLGSNSKKDNWGNRVVADSEYKEMKALINKK